MIGLEDRRSLVRNIAEAVAAGARQEAACEVAGISARTLQRWQACAGHETGDGRPRAVRPVPAHALSAAERQEILRVANEPRFADKPPSYRVMRRGNRGRGEWSRRDPRNQHQEAG